MRKNPLPLILTLVFLLFSWINLQAGTTWARAYGKNKRESANSVAVTTDGGFVVAGWTQSFGKGNSDFWVIKLDAHGNIIWEKTYGKRGREKANCIIQTKDGGFIVAGETTSYPRYLINIWVLKLDQHGNIVWQKSYGGPGNEIPDSIIETADGGYLISGTIHRLNTGKFKHRDFLLIKIDKNGKLQWQKAYGGKGDEEGHAVVQTSDGGFAVVGRSTSFSKDWGDFWVLKTDKMGTPQWEMTYGGPYDDRPYGLIQTSDGGYLLTGHSQSFGERPRDTNAWLLKLDRQGNVLWQISYGNRKMNEAFRAVETRDGGYAVVGISDPDYMASPDLWIFKIDRAGNLKWSKTYGGDFWESGYSIKEAPDGGLVAVGYSETAFKVHVKHVFAVKTDGNGNLTGCSAPVVHPLKVSASKTNATIKRTSIKPDKIKLTVLNTNVSPLPSQAQVEKMCH